MMCNDCRHAGILTEKGNWFTLQGRVKDADKMREMASELHDQCKGSCTCQHYMGINHV